MKYEVGTILDSDGVKGVVVENLPGNISVKWESTPHIISYDAEWLDENVKVDKSQHK